MLKAFLLISAFEIALTAREARMRSKQSSILRQHVNSELIYMKHKLLNKAYVSH